jgi:hypothetical protein
MRVQPCSADFAESASFQFVNSAVLAGSPEDVFGVVSSIEHEANWFPDFSRASWRTPEPPGAGAIRDYRLTYMSLVEHFTVWEPGSRLTFWVSECSLPLVRRFMEDYRLSAEGEDRTLLRWTVAYEPLPVLRPLHPILRPYFGRDFRRATANLTAYCERLFGSAVTDPMTDPVTGP